MRDKRTIGIGLVGLVVVAALVVGGLALLSDSLAEDSYTSEYSYDVEVSTNGTLTNATVLVPVPVADGEVSVAGALEDGDYYARPEAFSSRLVDTDRGPMLEITAAEFVVKPEYYRFVEDGELGRTERITAAEYDPDDPDMFVRDRDQYELQLRIESDDPIETRDPVGTEPVLEPRADASETTCLDGTDRCLEYTSVLSAEYDADPSTEVSIRVTNRGENSWWVGGWSSNWYTDELAVELTGPQADWIAVSGGLETEQGSYR
ncbi:hypothetical protein [Natronorubrum sulfidifaciens]|uniref:Uncharacterized protein n=1 Tax=Natronorubrum sulfidifaciens JCM 14089 TaxID=1230460 RepID=L9WJ67_9EURY|nr:hypothetical protein [Natronorubrum sulfidifaciens]ELY48398.1 hypothetical protein C495_02960 [Natronorubrum sulfidifaciens JCM 14089]